MKQPRWGHVYDFKLPGAQASKVVVLSEDDYNRVTRDVVIVPLYERAEYATHTMAVEVTPGWVANCTRVQQVPQDVLGTRPGRCPDQPLTRIRIGVRIYLDLDRLAAQDTRPPAARPRDSWWPRQGDVHYAFEPQANANKLFGILSEDDWNCRPNTRYSAAIRLTSKTSRPGTWRARWEVPTPGGCVVAGHLYSLLHDDLDRTPPKPPRPKQLAGSELALIATRLMTVLKLE